ncbi:MAG: hypothetical protein CL916_12105 [Deltaproteobacteria bacterium]|nr:hypothetical protein [Deltaproteobacteria bacterium]
MEENRMKESFALEDWTFSGKLVVTIPDATRPIDPLPALHAIALRASNIQKVVVGLGLHKPMKIPSTWSSFPIVQHNPDDCISTSVVDGIPGSVHRSFAKSEASLSIGIAELHQYAGFSGGYKGVAVGCGGRQTISQLHHRDRVLDPGVRIGVLTGNPFRECIDELGKAAGCQWALNYSPQQDQWFFGDPSAVLKSIASQSNSWYSVDKKYSSVLFSIPKSKGGSLYQASRAATYLALSPNPPLVKGAELWIEAPLDEGFGSEEGFVRALQQPYPWSKLLTGEPPLGAGAQRAIILAKVCTQYTIRLFGVRDPQLFRNVGLWASQEAAPRGSVGLLVSHPFYRLPQCVL